MDSVRTFIKLISMFTLNLNITCKDLINLNRVYRLLDTPTHSSYLAIDKFVTGVFCVVGGLNNRVIKTLWYLC